MKYKKKLIGVTLLLLVAATFVTLGSKSQAACDSAPTDKGTVTASAVVPSSGTYYIWSRNRAAFAVDNAYYLKIDSNCTMKVGDSLITANTWTWVNYQDGNSSNRMSVNLTAGSHTFRFYGSDPSVQVDRLVLSADASCTPTGMGDNCTNGNSTPPIVVTTPGTGTPTVGGTVQTGSSNPDAKTTVKVDGKEITTGTGLVGLDTSNLTDGFHDLTIQITNPDGTVQTVTKRILVQNNAPIWKKAYNQLYKALNYNKPLTNIISFTIVAAVLAALGVGLFMAWSRRLWETLPIARRIHLPFIRVPSFLRSKPATTSTAAMVGDMQNHGHGGHNYTNPFKFTLAGHTFSPNIPAIATIAAFAVIGSAALLYTSAAANGFVVEPESGTRTGVTTIADSSAAGGSYILFGTGAPGTCPAGQTGTPPNCVTPPTTCPLGQTGTPPNCVTPPVTTTGYPDATNTGVKAGITRTNSGSINSSSDGQVIQNLNINGSMYISHNNVTVRNVKFTNPGGSAILIDPNKSGTLIEDCEMDGSGNPGAEAAVGWARYTIRRCNIHHYGEGMAANGGTVIEDNFIHDFTNFIAAGAHQDGIQVEYPGGDIIRHNTILMNVDGSNANIHVSGEPGAALVENNLLGATGGKEISAAHGTWRNNKMTDRLRLPPSGGPLSRIFEYNFPHTICGTTFYDGPNAGQPVEGDGPC